jgi:hypothetical protein
MKKISQSPSYRAFKNKADAFLEEILLKARTRQGDALRKLMTNIQHNIVVSVSMLPKDADITDPVIIQRINHLRSSLEGVAMHSLNDFYGNWIRMRAFVYGFSYAASQRALLNTGVSKTPHKLDLNKRAEYCRRKSELGAVQSRILLSLYRLIDKAIDNVKMGISMGSTHQDLVNRAMSAFPRPERVKKNVVLRRMTEAKKDDEDDEFFKGPDFIDEDEWEKILDEYKEEYVPEWRDPRKGELEEPIYFGEDGDRIVYAWQLENEMVEDFVQAVSDGEVEAANAAGITQFVWVAILDKKTDQCCIKRNGLTNTEIKDKLKDEWAADECRATVPPAHFNCRCRAVPATDDLPDKPDDGAAQFEDWLNS